MFKAHGVVYHSSLGSRVIKKKKHLAVVALLQRDLNAHAREPPLVVPADDRDLPPAWLIHKVYEP